jgi:hypothetical protein
LIEARTFRASDFFETRQGVCRVLPPLTHELAETSTTWAKLLAPTSLRSSPASPATSRSRTSRASGSRRRARTPSTRSASVGSST